MPATSRRPHRVRVAAVALILALAAAPAAAKRTPAPCPDGRFDVDGLPLLPGGAPADGDVVTVAGYQVLLQSGCGLATLHVKATRKATRLRARWASCPDVKGPLRLKAAIDAASCGTMTGTLVARRMAMKRTFRADRHVRTTVSPGTFSLIQSRIFGGKGCVVSSCHGGAGTSGLDLRGDSAYDALVGVLATNPTARADGRLRVVPGDSHRSFLSDKLHGSLRAGEGDRMPLQRDALIPAAIKLVDAWIDAGAPPSGTIPDEPQLPPETFEPGTALPVPDPSEGYQMYLEGPMLAPHQEVEGCLWIPAPNPEDAWIRSIDVSVNPGTHHFAIWRYDRKNSTPVLNTWTPDDIACLSGATLGGNVGGSGVGGLSSTQNPPGVAWLLKGGGYYGLNAHYYNEFDVPVKIQVWTNFYRYQGTPLHKEQNEISLDTTFNIYVPVGQQAIRKGRYVNASGKTQHVVSLQGHMHKRGLRFSTWQSDGTKVFDDLDWSHPVGKQWWPPFDLAPNDWFDYECLEDNGVTRPVYRDAQGNPAPLKFGISAENEMCILIVNYYDD